MTDTVSPISMVALRERIIQHGEGVDEFVKKIVKLKEDGPILQQELLILRQEILEPVIPVIAKHQVSERATQVIVIVAVILASLVTIISVKGYE